MLGDSGVIVWHDFNSGIHGEVTRYMAGESQKDIILSVPGSMLAVGLYGEARETALNAALRPG